MAFLIHHSVSFSPIDVSFYNDPHVELQAVKAQINQSDVSIFNVYAPPASSCQRQHRPDLSSILNRADDDSFVLGDFNAHHSAWDANLVDARGRLLANDIANSPLIILNDTVPTRVPSSANQPSSSPDISLSSPHLAVASTWSVSSSLSSDHLPILISLPSSDSPSDPSSSSYTNFRQADIPKFRQITEAAFSAEAPPCSAAVGVATFQRILNDASKWSIPAGRRRCYVPGVSRDVISLREERDNLRDTDPSNPEIERLTVEINSLVWNEKRVRWRKHVEDSDRRTNPSKHWNMLRGLSGKRAHVAPNQPVDFDGVCCPNPKDAANRFMRLYAFPPSSNKIFRHVKRELK